MKSWKLYAVNSNDLLWGLLFFLLPTPIARGCGPVEYIFHGYSFLDPAIANADLPAAPYFLPFEEIYKQYGRQEKIQPLDNLREWQERFCDIAPLQDIRRIVYEASIREMRLLKTAAQTNGIAVPSALEDNIFARHLVQDRCLEIIDYLIFAKECEPHVVASDPWEENPRNVAAMERLIEEGLNAFLELESHYVRLRYAYQLVRLAHYAGKYSYAIELYDYLMPKIDNDPSIIEYWIEGHRAGALRALGKNAEAAYLYALIFQNCHSKRESAFQSFRINNQEEWEQCLLMCKNNEERAVLYALRGNRKNSLAVEEMRTIYQLDPDSHYLEPLLLKEMHRLEKDLLGLSFNDEREENRRRFNIPRPRAGTYVIELQEFVRQVIREQKVDRLPLWVIARGYLELLAGDFYSAGNTFETAGDMVEDDLLREQLAAFQLALEISSWEWPTGEVERKAAAIIHDNDLYDEYEDFPDFLYDKLAELYQQGGYPGKAFLCLYDLYQLKPNPQADIVDDLLNVCRKDRPNRMERELITQEDATTIEEELVNIKATDLFGDLRLEAALETFKEIDRSKWNRFGLFNPFIERIDDCVHCPIPERATLYNRGNLIEKLLDMEYTARANPREEAEIYYQLGLAYLNMTYFGYAWEAMDFFRSGVSLAPWHLEDGENVIPHYLFPYGNEEIFDCSRAQLYFDRARLNTDSTELAAKATFMAAKCRRNTHYVRFPRQARDSFPYFDLLIENYSDTDFYRYIIEECKTFEAYVNR